jgi:hypothetical protein
MSNGFTITTETETRGEARIPLPEGGRVDYVVVAEATGVLWANRRMASGTTDGNEFPPDAVWFHIEGDELVIRWSHMVVA